MAIIDRFEEDFAVLEREDGTTERISRALLPPGTREGDVLRMEAGGWTADAQATLVRRADMRDKLRRAFGK